MKEKTLLKISLSILILIFSFLIIISTYSKYITTTEDNTSLHIANWNIKLNDKDITESRDFTDNIQLIFDEDENKYIDEDVIAPTSKGHFNLSLESTGTELSFRYDLSVISDENLPDFRITGYTKDDDPTYIRVDEPSPTFEGIVEPAEDTDTEVKNEYTFYIEWYDKEDNILNNQEDVSVSKSNSFTNPSASIPLSLKITQIEDENIEENEDS